MLSKPILGFVTNGAQKDFIQESGLGIICDPDDMNQAILSIVNLINYGKEFTPNKEYLSKFHRKNLAKSLAVLLKKHTEISKSEKRTDQNNIVSSDVFTDVKHR